MAKVPSTVLENKAEVLRHLRGSGDVYIEAIARDRTYFVRITKGEARYVLRDHGMDGGLQYVAVGDKTYIGPTPKEI
jgi:hypothetical protein